MKRLVAMAAVLAVAGVVACCGEGQYGSPRATFETMRAAAKAGDRDAAMACYDKETAAKMAEMEKLAKEFAADAMSTEQMMEQAKEAKVEIGEEKIDGDTATLQVTMDGRTSTMNFVKEAGAWKIHVPMPDLSEMKEGLEKLKGLKGLGDKLKGLKLPKTDK